MLNKKKLAKYQYKKLTIDDKESDKKKQCFKGAIFNYNSFYKINAQVIVDGNNQIT